MDILISVAATIAEYTVAPIGRQMGYLIFYKDNFKELKDQVQVLEGAREQIKHSIEAEARNGREIEVAVQDWVDRADEIIEEAKQLCEDPRHANVGCSKCSFLDLRSRHQLSRNAKKVAKNIAEVKENGKFDPVGYLPPLNGVGFTSTARGIKELESRKLIKQNIIVALRDPKVSKMGVFGLGGVGKTTIVKEVAKQVKDDKLFDEVVMTNVSQNPDLERIQDELADLLGLRFEEKSIVGRGRRLCERIKKEKTILIVLDDIWERLDLEKLGIPSEDNHKGCKILLTSRNQDTLRKMETERDFRVEVLDEEETWSLFQIMIGDAVTDAGLHNIATQVAKKCAGLPVLVVTMARALKNKDIYYWKDALNQLERVDNGEMNGTVYSAVEFSYNQMESNEMKAIFLLCGVHAYGTVNWVNDLLKYGIGLGIFKPIDTIEDARNRLYTIISDLKASCLLLEDDVSARVKMHDIVCDVAISIASRDRYVFTMKKNAQLKNWPTENFLRKCTQIILMDCCIQKLPERLDCPNLELLCIGSSDNRSLKIPHSFFDGLGNLEVLDLTDMIISLLPISFGSLTKLKTLCLDHCVLGDMDGIGALKNLEILSFSHSSMEKLPREIGQLIHLKMLDLSYSGIAVIPPDIISNLTKLEELYMGIISTKWEVENSTKQSRNATLAELRHLINLAVLEIHIQEAWILPRDLMFEKLERYKIVIGDVWEWSDKYWASKMLKIKLGTNIHLEHGIKALIKRAEDLHLDQINGISNVLYQLNGEGFPLLKHLYIQNNAEIQHIINSRDRIRPHIFFPKLETLELHNLTSLEKICYGALTDNSFGKLRVIIVKSCGQLDYLLSIPMVKALSQLVEIEVSECNSMKKIVFLESTDCGETIDKIEFCSLRSLTLRNLPTVDGFCPNILTNIPTSFFNAKVVFSNLETLKLSSINMNKIWDDDESSIAYSICNLTNMIVEDCGGLKYLFSSSMVESLLNLKRLQISRCYGMEEIIAKKGTNRTSLKEVRFIKLDTITINDMEKLETVWHYQFNGLKTLEVRKCEKLDNIFPSYVHGAFGSLETLMVSDCNSVEEIFQLNSEMQSVEDTTQLKQLTLLRLPKLKRIWSRDPQNILRFNNLQAVGVEDCEHLEYLFPLSIATSMPQLEKITIKQARRMKEIVSKKEGTMDSPVIFEFNHLTSLVLWNLDEFRGFLAGEHSLACPLLRKIDIFGCAKLQLFKTQCTSSQIEVISKHQPLFTLEEVSANLEELSLNEKDALRMLNGHYGKILFYSIEILRLQCFQETPILYLNDFLERFLSTTTLQVRNSSFKTLFPSKEIRRCSNKSPTQIKNLWLFQLEQLEHIWNDDFLADSFVQNLEDLFIADCSSLIRLAPPLISFNNLTSLGVTDCKGLIYLMTSSSAKSLVHLTDLMVNNCEMIEDVVRTDEGESEEAEMAFESLEYLKLTSLLSLKNFCSGKHTFIFPSLEILIVTGCPKMQNFSSGVTKAPILKLVQVENGKKRWKEDLNTTIKQLFLEKEVPDSNES